MHQSSVRPTTAGTGRTFLAIVAILSLLLSALAIARPALATEQEGGVGQADCPAGTEFIANFDQGDLEIGMELADGVTIADIQYEGGEVSAVTVTNESSFQYAIAVKGGSNQEGNFVFVEPGTTSGWINVTDNPTISNLSVCKGEEVVEEQEFLEVVKNLVPSEDPGTFQVGFDGPDDNDAWTTYAGDGTTTGSVEVVAGSYLIAEAAGDGTSLSEYTTSIACYLGGPDGAAATLTGGNTLVIGEGESYYCVITNERVAQEEETVEVSIMKHLCADVATVAEFEAIEDAGVAGLPGGEGTLSGLAATVLACPTIVLTGDVPTSGAVSSGNVNFDFTVIDSKGTQVLSTDGAFVQAALCEVGIDVDVNEDGDKLDCLDTSHYMFEVVDGIVVITETNAPAGHRFGTIRFTPGSDDADALVGSIRSVEATGVIRLDTRADGDNAVMVHAYNFVTEDTQSGGGGGNTPAQNQTPREGTQGGNPLPNTAISPIPTGSVPAALLALLMLSGLGAAVYATKAEVRRRR